MMSHDWPQGLELWNEALLRKKSYLRDDMQSGRLGCALLDSHGYHTPNGSLPIYTANCCCGALGG